MRLDHLLSREEEVGVVLLLICQGQIVMSRESMESLSHMAGERARGDAQHYRECGQSAHGRNRDNTTSSGDALTGDTRSHPEHDG